MHVLTQVQRSAVIEEAQSWIGTPYHHQGWLKGIGTDCAFLLIAVYHKVGLIPWIDPRPYPMDWHFHRDEERYLGWVKKYAYQVESPQPGDIALYKFGRVVSHGAIVTEWPHMIHSVNPGGVMPVSNDDSLLTNRLAGFWSLRESD